MVELPAAVQAGACIQVKFAGGMRAALRRHGLLQMRLNTLQRMFHCRLPLLLQYPVQDGAGCTARPQGALCV